MDTTAAVTELRNKREQEVMELKKNEELERRKHEEQIQDTRQKYQAQVEQLNEELESLRKVHLLLQNKKQLII